MDLSIIILSYNTKDLTRECLEALTKNLAATPLQSEIIIIDNNSTDGSREYLKEMNQNLFYKNIKLELIFNEENVGYPRGNNQGIAISKGRYILLLNSDAIIQDVNFEDLLQYMESHKEIGVLSVRLQLPTGKIDPASHRGFPTPWNAFCYFTKLEKIFGKSPFGRFVGGYHLTYKNLNTIHEIDAPAGAFFLSPRHVMQEVNGFDETFFMYGEDLDLSYRIKEKGYKIIYYPLYTTLHMKRSSGLQGKNKEVRKKTRIHFFEAMKIFYAKHYEKKYPSFIKSLVFLFIDLKIKSI